tara:strand:- start:844 stop:981 length:138 start_codon:yes stop_codon:yes gene_type:complete
MAAGAQMIAYALNGNPNVDLINPNTSPPFFGFIQSDYPDLGLAPA